MLEFNINDYCWVQLTDAGKEALKKQHNELNEQSRGFLGEYKPKEEDNDGWSKWQMHEIMNQLGHMLINDGDVPFKPTIRIDA